jgi:hypothetical protein
MPPIYSSISTYFFLNVFLSSTDPTERNFVALLWVVAMHGTACRTFCGISTMNNTVGRYGLWIISTQYSLFVSTIFLYASECVCAYLKDNSNLDRQRRRDKPADIGGLRNDSASNGEQTWAN